MDRCPIPLNLIFRSFGLGSGKSRINNIKNQLLLGLFFVLFGLEISLISRGRCISREKMVIMGLS